MGSVWQDQEHPTALDNIKTLLNMKPFQGWSLTLLLGAAAIALPLPQLKPQIPPWQPGALAQTAAPIVPSLPERIPEPIPPQ